MTLLFDTATWADAIADLPVSGPLPCRTVLVFNERTAHALRRELLSTGRASVLAGTRFMTPVAAATEVLHAAGIAVRLDGSKRRRARLSRAFRLDLDLKHFPRELLLGATGWADAFARAIDELEAAALRPMNLRFEGASSQLHDVATVWEATQDLAGDVWSGSRALAEAAAVLSRDIRMWPFDGPTLAALAPAFSVAEAHFAAVLPGAHVRLFAARPVRETYLDRVAEVLGGSFAKALRAKPLDARAHVAANAASASERDVLAAYFLETPEVLADAARPRSRGIDDTVHLEEHAGVEAELEAAADWVAKQVIEHQTPLDQIAVLAPRREPLVAMIADRIARIGVGMADSPRIPVFVEGGRPLKTCSAGARSLAVVRALRDYLPVQALAELLPTFRPADPEARRLSRGRAYAVAYSLGTSRGSPAEPHGATTWDARITERIAQLESALARARLSVESAPDEDPDARDAERLLGDLQMVGPAIRELVQLCAHLLDAKPLRDVAPSIAAFLASRVLLPIEADGTNLQPAIASTLAVAASDPELGGLVGDDALAWIDDELSALRVPTARFGDPAVYVGTIRGAIGLPFHSVRIVGLAEGHWPSVAREDAVLPEALRATISGAWLRSAGDQSLSQLHALAMVLRGARNSVVISTPRVDVSRSQREPSALLLEIASALGRAGPKGEPVGTVPDLRLLRRDAFLPARRAMEAFRRAWVVSEGAQQMRVARYTKERPTKRWFDLPAVDLVRIQSYLTCGGARATDGVLDPGVELDLPGLTPGRPISASALRDLLQCPYRFLLQRVLRWREPASASPPRELDPMTYGSLFHKVAEDFFREHGEAFSARERSVDAWKTEVRNGAQRAMEELLERYPLLGDTVRQQELSRLSGDLDRFLNAEWGAPIPARFVEAEYAFGFSEPAPVEVDGGKLFVRGFIDRIDAEGPRLMVRDLKTGSPHPRRGDEAEPQPLLDIQIGLYALMVRPMAAAQGLGVGAAYVYTGLHGDRERAFRDDIGALESSTKQWLAIAEALLRQRAFPRTPVPGDCRFCGFAAVCGDSFHPQVAEMFEQTTNEPLRSLRVLKLGEEA
ncbi:MAG: PD-(D/E)XK nuclease family protein [Polyangiaceae bacterium]|nr:PD-(D/E)XK nuclease family protein [Polyangiaceae bacterium]